MDGSMRLVNLGKTGSGKSSLVNTIFGEDMCKINHTSKSETSECKAATKCVDGKSLTLIDTPGFFDTNMSEDDLKPEILRCIVESAPGPHAFLIVFKVDKFTKHEQEVITKIKEYFSEEAFKFATVVFTHGDQLQEGQTIEDFVRKDQNLSDLVKKCGGRCHIIDNKYWKEKPKNKYRSNQFQVEEILKTVEKTIKDNKDGYYTNEMLQEMESIKQDEIERIRKSSENMSEEEIREKAKCNVFENLLMLMTGTATGVVLGAYFGVTIMIKSVLKILKVLKELLLGISKLAGGDKSAEGEVETLVAAGAAAGKAALTIPSAAFKALAVTAAVVGVAGGVAGGMTGYLAAEEAETPQEAAEKAADAVKKGANYILKTIDEM